MGDLAVLTKRGSIFCILFVLLFQDNFKFMHSGEKPSREEFLTVLAKVDAFLIRATYHSVMGSSTLKRLSLDTAVPASPGALPETPMVEMCQCPEGYTGFSCEVTTHPCM